METTPQPTKYHAPASRWRLFRFVLICGLPLSLVVSVNAKAFNSSIVRQWNNALLDAIRQESTAPCLASRNLAMLHIAMFDAANASESQYEGFYYKESAPHNMIAELVAAGAAETIANVLYPSQKARFTKLFSEQTGRSNSDHVRSLEFGAHVARLIFEQRENDNSSLSVTYIPRQETGKWTRTPPQFKPPEMPHWKNVVPFAIEDPAIFATQGPPSLQSAEYAADLKEVKQLGSRGSQYRTATQTETANFWSCFSYTATPAGHWNEIACRLIAEHKIDFMESLRLMALLNIAMADAGIVGWQEKYKTHLWRPIHAIRQADQDGNPSTQAELNWQPYLETPPHPEYVSGHSVFSGSGAEILRLYFGTDRIAFIATSDSVPGVERRYQSFSECEQEIAISRVYGGIHYRFSAIDGLIISHAIAREIFKNHLTKTDKH